ncbi:MAG: bifunctional DNA-formamidopyrimidine glycosylase/DNA-(apurinic or apyrimidinic site) lyase [Hyphomicrobiaceae bacterium]
MPELPEVETVCRGLEPVLKGATIARVIQRRPDLRFPLPERFVERLEGRRIESLTRRAKYILGALDSGEVLTIHLGMTGRFTIAMPGGPNGRQLGEFVHDAGTISAHDHIVIETQAGASVTYNDARRFGYMSLIPATEMAEHPHFKNLGIEPLGEALTAGFLAERAKGRKTDLKAFLMDQRIIAGLGNIYVCEALHRAGLNPKRSASILASRSPKAAAKVQLLAQAIRQVLGEAIVAGGSTLRDYRHTDGSLGYFQHAFAVYGREGEPCRREGCDGTVRRSVQAGRSTFHCTACQQ